MHLRPCGTIDSENLRKINDVGYSLPSAIPDQELTRKIANGFHDETHRGWHGAIDLPIYNLCP